MGRVPETPFRLIASEDFVPGNTIGAVTGTPTFPPIAENSGEELRDVADIQT